MKKRIKSNTSKGDRGQMILLAAFLMAVVIVGLAVVIGGAFFTQSSTGDTGVSQMTTQITDEVDAAEETSDETVEFVSEEVRRERGANLTEVCANLVDQTALQQQAAEQISEEEVLLDIELVGDCEDFEGIDTFLAAQQQPGPLPGVNVTELELEDEQCSVLHAQTNYPDHTDQFINALVDIYSPSTVPPNPDPNLMVDALEMAPDIDMNSLDPRVDPIDYVEECIEIDIEEGRDPADIVFAIDTTGSMAFGDDTTASDIASLPEYGWQSPSDGVWEPDDGDWPRELYDRESDIPIRDEWMDIGSYSSWDGSPASEERVLYDSGSGDLVKLQDDDPAQVGVITYQRWECEPGAFITNYDEVEYTNPPFGSPDDVDGLDCEYLAFGWQDGDWQLVEEEGGNTWEVEYRTGGTDELDESELYEPEWRVDAPQRMWFTQLGLIRAVDDLNQTEPDRAGLLEYDASTFQCTACPTTLDHTVVGINDANHRQSIIDTTVGFEPGGRTNIANALEESRAEVEARHGEGPEASERATKNVVVMTDGIHNEGQYPQYQAHQVIEDNIGQYQDVFVHTVVLGDIAANDPNAVEDMGLMANDPNPQITGADPGVDWDEENDLDRPNGTMIVSDDPADAEDIFDQIIATIEDETEFKNPNATDSNGTVDASIRSGAVDEIYQLSMNVTEFDGDGEYEMALEDDGTVIWEMVIDNRPTYTDQNGNLVQMDGFQVRFNSDEEDDIDDFVINSTTSDNLTEGDGYAQMNLIEEEFSMSSSETGKNPADYPIDEAKDVVTDYIADDGDTIAIIANDTDPQSQANGTFGAELVPLDGNHTKHFGGEDSLYLGDECDSNPGNDIPKCGEDDSDADKISTVQIREAKLTVTVETPTGIAEREITANIEEISIDV